MSIVSDIDSTVLILGAGIAIAICIAAGLVVKKIRNRARDNLHKMALDPLQTSHSVKEIPADYPGNFFRSGQGFCLCSAPKGNRLSSG